MSDVLDRHSALARWKTGPDRDALRQLFGEQPVTVRLDRVHFPDKRPVQLVYEAKMPSGLVCTILAESCPDDPCGCAAKATESLRKSRNGQREALEKAPIVADRTSRLVIRRPGLDERLPGLRILYDRAFAREIVESLTGQDHPGTVSTRLMAHRLGKRAVVRIDVGGKRVFARLRAIKSDNGERRLERHMAVWKALCPRGALAVPEPLGAEPDIGLSLFGELSGLPPRFDRDHTAIAQALKTWQALDLSSLPIHTGADENAMLREWHTRCRTYLPELADSISPVLERLGNRLEAAGTPQSPCHRDLHEKQILVDGQRAGFLDFDTLSLADPALDPGNLLAHLFLAGIDERPLARAFDFANLALWRQAALLRLAMIYAFTATPAAAIQRLLKEADD